MPATPNVSPEDAQPTPNAAWVGFFAEAHRLAALAQQRRAAQLLCAPSAQERREEKEVPVPQKKRRKPGPKAKLKKEVRQIAK